MKIKNEIIVRKPKMPKNWFTELVLRYNNRWYKWFYSLPKNGDKIKITWLPNPINHPSTPSCYIGSEGVVQDMDESALTSGSFSLIMETSILIMSRGSFNYIRI